MGIRFKLTKVKRQEEVQEVVQIECPAGDFEYEIINRSIMYERVEMHAICTEERQQEQDLNEYMERVVTKVYNKLNEKMPDRIESIIW